MDQTIRKATKLWTLAQPTVSAFVASVVRDPRDREDVIQETALAIFDSIDNYDDKYPFNAWAIGVARNQVGLYLRRRKRDRHVFSEKTVANLHAAFKETAESSRLDFVAFCMKKLEGRAFKLCELRYRQGLRPAEIGKRIGMKANAVAKALQRVREQIRICIETNAAQDGGVS